MEPARTEAARWIDQWVAESGCSHIDDITMAQLVYIIARLTKSITDDPPNRWDGRWSTVVQEVMRHLPSKLPIAVVWTAPEPSMEPLFVNRKSPDVVNRIAAAHLFRKFGTVQARKADPGEKITTVLADGTEETANAAQDGDWVVTNPSGEQYIISGSKFLNRYAATDEPGVWRAVGFCRAAKNPFGRSVRILASWGEEQIGSADCWFADTCDQDGDNLGGEPYLIDNDAFHETYRIVLDQRVV